MNGFSLSSPSALLRLYARIGRSASPSAVSAEAATSEHLCGEELAGLVGHQTILREHVVKVVQYCGTHTCARMSQRAMCTRRQRVSARCAPLGPSCSYCARRGHAGHVTSRGGKCAPAHTCLCRSEPPTMPMNAFSRMPARNAANSGVIGFRGTAHVRTPHACHGTRGPGCPEFSPTRRATSAGNAAPRSSGQVYTRRASFVPVSVPSTSKRKMRSLRRTSAMASGV
jgi:hypothetical protein